MTERRKKLLRWVGYPLLGWTTFIFAMHFTFPYDSVRDRLVELLSKDYDVGIAEVSPGLLPGRVSVKGITLTTRPAEGEKPRTLMIDRVDLSIGWLALIGKTVSVDIKAELGEGRIVGNVETSARGLNVDMKTDGLSLETIPGIAVVTGGAPLKGPIQAHIKLDVPGNKWAGSSGAIDLSCDDCVLGDGVTKAKFPMAPGQTNAFNEQGMTLPRIHIGKLVAKIDIKQGTACIVELDSKSNEGELYVEGGLKMADPFKDTQAQLYAKLKFSDEFKKASQRNQDFDILLTTGARQPDGWATFQTKGPLMMPRWVGAKAPPPPMKECVGVAAPPATSRVASTGTPPKASPTAPIPLPTPSAPQPAPHVGPPPYAPGPQPGPPPGTPPPPAAEAPPPAMPAPPPQPEPTPTPVTAAEAVPVPPPPQPEPVAQPEPAPTVEIVPQPAPEPPPGAEAPQ